MTTYYVATTGSDGAAGSILAPWATIKYAVAHVAAGDTVNIRTGTYAESIRTYNGDAVISGTAGNVITIQNYNSEVVTMQPGSGNYEVLWIGGVSYTTWKGIIFDGTGMTQDAVGVSNSSLHTTFDGCEFKNAYHQCLSIAHGSHFAAIRNCLFHEWGQTASNQYHAIYITSGDTNDVLIEYNTIHDGTGFGIHIYNGDGTKCDRTIIRNNRIYHTGFRGGIQNSATSISAILMTDGDDCLIYNNLVYNNLGTGIESAFGSGTSNLGIYSNTIYNNGTVDGQAGINLGAATSNAIVKNNIVYGNGLDIVDDGSGTTNGNNLTSDPSFTNAGTGDFTLQVGSTAIDTGADLSLVFTTDFSSITRTVPWDKGAIQYASGVARLSRGSLMGAG